MKNLFRSLIPALLVGGLLLLLSGCGVATTKSTSSGTEVKKGTKEDALAFYKDKNINFIVPYATGGGYDQYVRLVAPYLQKYIPGTTVVVRNVPGGGSLTGTNELYLAKGDGLTVGIINGVGMVTDQAVAQTGVKFDLNKFNWIGRFNAEPKIVVVNATSPLKTIDDLINAKGAQKFSINGVGSSEYVGLEVTKKILVPQMDIIPGYNTSAECEVAMLRGEVVGTSGSVSSKMPLIENKKSTPILLYGEKRDPALPNVPLATEITTGKEKDMAANFTTLLQLGRDVAAPPEVPAERLALLQEAFAKALADPELLDKAKKAKLEIEPLTGPDLAKLISQSLKMPEDLKALMAKAMTT